MTNKKIEKLETEKTEKLETKKTEKIIAIRVYQSVNFCGKEVSHFTTVKSPKTKPCKITFHSTIAGIKIESEDESIIVPFTNVSSITLESSKTIAKEKQRQDEMKYLKKISNQQRDVTKRPI